MKLVFFILTLSLISGELYSQIIKAQLKTDKLYVFNAQEFSNKDETDKTKYLQSTVRYNKHNEVIEVEHSYFRTKEKKLKAGGRVEYSYIGDSIKIATSIKDDKVIRRKTWMKINDEYKEIKHEDIYTLPNHHKINYKIYDKNAKLLIRFSVIYKDEIIDTLGFEKHIYEVDSIKNIETEYVIKKHDKISIIKKQKIIERNKSKTIISHSFSTSDTSYKEYPLVVYGDSTFENYTQDYEMEISNGDTLSIERTELTKLDSINEIEIVHRKNIGGTFKRISKKVNSKRINSVILSFVDSIWIVLVEEETTWNKFDLKETVKTTRYKNAIPVLYEFHEYEFY